MGTYCSYHKPNGVPLFRFCSQMIWKCKTRRDTARATCWTDGHGLEVGVFAFLDSTHWQTHKRHFGSHSLLQETNRKSPIVKGHAAWFPVSMTKWKCRIWRQHNYHTALPHSNIHRMCLLDPQCHSYELLGNHPCPHSKPREGSVWGIWRKKNGAWFSLGNNTLLSS